MLTLYIHFWLAFSHLIRKMSQEQKMEAVIYFYMIFSSNQNNHYHPQKFQILIIASNSPGYMKLV